MNIKKSDIAAILENFWIDSKVESVIHNSKTVEKYVDQIMSIIDEQKELSFSAGYDESTQIHEENL